MTHYAAGTVLLVGSMLLGCSNCDCVTSSRQDIVSNESTNLSLSSAPSFTSPVQRLVDWQGFTVNRVINSFGEPTTQTTFNPSRDPMPEYRIEILNDYPQSDVLIQEYIYQYEDGSRIFFWFHVVDSDEEREWLVLQAMKVAPGVMF